MHFKFLQKDLAYSYEPIYLAMHPHDWKQTRIEKECALEKKNIAENVLRFLYRQYSRSDKGPNNRKGDRLVFNGYCAWIVHA